MPKVNTAWARLLSHNEHVAPTLVRFGPCCLFVRGDLRALRVVPPCKDQSKSAKTIAAPPYTTHTTNDNSDLPTTHDNHTTCHMNN